MKYAQDLYEEIKKANSVKELEALENFIIEVNNRSLIKLHTNKKKTIETFQKMFNTLLAGLNDADVNSVEMFEKVEEFQIEIKIKRGKK
jgi:indole-3-glycerol phosphate synthase